MNSLKRYTTAWSGFPLSKLQRVKDDLNLVETLIEFNKITVYSKRKDATAMLAMALERFLISLETMIRNLCEVGPMKLKLLYDGSKG